MTKSHQVTVSTGYGTGVSIVKVTTYAGVQHFPSMLSVPLTLDLAVRAAEDRVLRDPERLGVVPL